MDRCKRPSRSKATNSRSPRQARRHYGITAQVKQTIVHEHTSHIDYEEIESLLKGIEHIAKIDATVTKLASFRADYKTTSDLFHFQDQLGRP